MPKGKMLLTVFCALSAFAINGYAFEFNSGTTLQGATGPEAKQGAPKLLLQKDTPPAVRVMQDNRPKVEEIDAVQENVKSRVVVKYSDFPVSVPVSRDEVNVISFPYAIENVRTSREGIKEIGKAEKEFSLSVLKDLETDVAVKTLDKTFLLTLVPTTRHATHVVVEDAGAAGKKAGETEKEFPHVELMANLIKKALRNEPIEGYVALSKSEVLNSPDATFVFKREIMGLKYKVVLIDILNRTKEVLQVREDMPFIENVVSKLTGHPYAISLTREFIQPRNAETERKGEFVSTIVAVVSSQQ